MSKVVNLLLNTTLIIEIKELSAPNLVNSNTLNLLDAANN
jgi:hypothetical protein